MSALIKLGNTILISNPHNTHDKNKVRSISLIHYKSNNSLNTKKTQGHFFKKSSSLLNYNKITYEKIPIRIPKFYKKHNFLDENKNKLPKINNNNTDNNNDINYTVNTRYYNDNNKGRNKNSNNNKEYNSFNERKNYLLEANKIISQRFEDKNTELLSQKYLNKRTIISDSREICRNNYVIQAIRKNIDKINLKEKNYKKSLIKSEKEMKTDVTIFRNFLDSKNKKIKEENEALVKYKELHEQAIEKYDKELFKYKKLSEELEKKIKITWVLKNYGEFIYKILGMNFWLEGIPEINQKTKNFEDISDLIIEKFKLLNNKEEINKEEDFFDDGFLILKFNELEERVILTIRRQQYLKNFLNDNIDYKETSNKMNTTIFKLSSKDNEVTKRKKMLQKNISKSENIKLDDETPQKFLEYIKELGRETEKYNIDIHLYFPDVIVKESEERIKEYDSQYFTVKTLNNLKKKETLINKFVEYIERIENSENKDIILNIEQERKNKNKKEKLQKLKIKQQQLHDAKNQKALERNTRFVVKGRIVPQVYQFQKNKDPLEIKENKVKDDIELLYDNEDD